MIPSSLTLDISLERPRLVRLCAQLIGDLDAAEDLAQETLLEAWRNLHKLHNPAGYAQWLSAIARNVCQRWAHKRGRDSHLISLEADDDLTTAALGDALTDDFHIELELEREELARLLDRAMALLPPNIRATLVARYVEELPLAEVAARLGVSEGAVKMRLQRGKLALRSMLMTDLIGEAATYGLIRGVDQQWQETRIWCTLCGQRRLMGRWTEDRQLWLKCPNCTLGSDFYQQGGMPELFMGIKGYKPALNRVHGMLANVYKQGPVGHIAQCLRCNRNSPLRIGFQPDARRPHHYIAATCPACGTFITHTSLHAIALGMPETLRFWREHPRIRALPEREMDISGSTAIVTGIESVAGNARLEIIAIRETFQILDLHTHQH